MIIDHVIIADILIDGPCAEVAAEAIRTVSLTGETVTPSIIGASEVARYVLFLAKLRPYLFRHAGTHVEVSGLIEKLFSSAGVDITKSTNPTVMSAAFKLSLESGLNFSLSHLASQAFIHGEKILAARSTVAALASVPSVNVKIISDYGSVDVALISVQLIS